MQSTPTACTGGLVFGFLRASVCGALASIAYWLTAARWDSSVKVLKACGGRTCVAFVSHLNGGTSGFCPELLHLDAAILVTALA